MFLYDGETLTIVLHNSDISRFRNRPSLTLSRSDVNMLMELVCRRTYRKDYGNTERDEEISAWYDELFRNLKDGCKEVIDECRKAR